MPPPPSRLLADRPRPQPSLLNASRAPRVHRSAINHHCFPALLADPANFTLIIESIKWAFKHTERNVAETGLNTLLELLNNVQASQVMNDFYRAYYLGLLQDIFSVLTDTLHKPGFKLQAMILSHLFLAVESGAITTPLNPEAGATKTNQQYLRELLLQMFSSSFPNLTQAQLTAAIQVRGARAAVCCVRRPVPAVRHAHAGPRSVALTC